VKQTREVRARINSQIRVREVRVIDADGEQIGVLDTREALSKAEEAGLDLVEVSANAKPPVCRIMDYGKYRYEQSKKAAEAKKKQSVVEVKEIKLRPKTEKHDLDFKVKNIKKFLGKNNKVKVTLRFRGREIVYAQTIGRAVLDKVVAEIGDAGVVIQQPGMEGRQMVMMVAPNKK
jgi:translation initiation factor IF-3